MHWSAILLLAMNAPAANMEVAHNASGSFASYTQAWHAAKDAERPMLVILNPAQGEGRRIITEDELRADEKIQPKLNDYVVAVIDTGTEHGKQVHELFGNAALPRVVVIDKEQKSQIFRTSDELSHEKLAEVLSQHKDGVVPQPVKVSLPAYGGCPNCQKRTTF
jgi:hypothetical protein